MGAGFPGRMSKMLSWNYIDAATHWGSSPIPLLRLKSLIGWNMTSSPTISRQSCFLPKFDYRKPDPEIYWEAAKRVGLSLLIVSTSVIIQNGMLLAHRKAGFGMVSSLWILEKQAKEPPEGENMPDYIIHKCSDLLGYISSTEFNNR